MLRSGDADGDLKAVKKNNGLFYPVAPGFEQDAWNRLPETFERFTAGTYAGAREAELLAAFAKVLLPAPPWEAPGYDHAAEYRKKQEIRKSLYARRNPTGSPLTL